MKVTIQPRIKISAHTFKVNYGSGLEERHRKTGFCDLTNGVILIEPKQMDSAKLDVLVHELLHIIDYYFANKMLAEDQVAMLVAGIVALLDGLNLEFDWSLIKEVNDGINRGK